MFQFLLKKLPRDIVVEIALFEGRIFRAYLCEYISELYSGVYMSYFGKRYCLKNITSEFRNYHGLLSPLPFFAAWCTIFRNRFPQTVKVRKPRKFMKPFNDIIPKNILIRERLKMEQRLEYMFPTPTKSHPESAFVRYHLRNRLEGRWIRTALLP
jgi:hypothetical protein